MSLSGRPSIKPTPPPSKKETREDLIKEQETEDRLLVRRTKEISRLGAEQTRAKGTGLNLE